tara:strand:+ start:255651 stop:256670 length:1020 start_codon:yes stop_codon:yes gene_type:complete
MSTDALIAEPLSQSTDVAPRFRHAGTAPADPSDTATVAESKTDSRSRAGQGGLFADLVQLTKPRIVVMILVTTVASSLIAAGHLVAAETLFWLLLGTGMVAGSAGAANQIWERVIDCEMARTATRPLPDGRINLSVAFVFTAVLGIAGSAILWAWFGATPAVAGIATWLIYVLAYTPMKTRTAWNTTVGAIAGALPVLIGYTATGGSLSDPSGWLLLGVLATWQYPHFMAIAWMYRRQYAEAGFCMTTTVEPTGRSAGIQAIVGSLVLIACGIALCLIPAGIIGGVLGSIAVFVSCYPMLKASIRFARQPDDALARTLLRSSLLVLPAVLLVVTLRVFW